MTTKNLTYTNMAVFIREQDTAKELMKEFEKQINLSKVQKNPYRAVLTLLSRKEAAIRTISIYTLMCRNFWL